MAFSHKTTFLRSAILEDPFCLGDLLGPEDVLRIENNFPDLFQAPEFDYSSPHDKPFSFNQLTNKIDHRPKSATLPSLYDKLSQTTQGCSRGRCKIQTTTSPVRKFKPGQKPVNSRSQSRSPPRPPPPLKSTNKNILPPPATTKVKENHFNFNSRLYLSKSRSYDTFQTDFKSTQRPISASKSLDNNKLSVKLPPVSPRLPVSARHAPRSAGFLKPAPILVKKRNKMLKNEYKGKSPASSVTFVDFKENKAPLSRFMKDGPTQLSLTLPALKELIEQRFKTQIELSKQEEQNKIMREREGSSETYSHHYRQTVQTSLSTQLHYNSTSDTNIINQIEQAKHVSMLSDILEYSEDKTENLSLSSTTSPSLSDFSHSPPHNLINFKSQQQQRVPSREEEDYLTQESMNRCEQLLLAKILAKEYEKDGKFQKNSFQQNKKQVPKPPIHSILLKNFKKQNKSYESILNNYPSVLEKIAIELIHAEVTKIVHEEQEILSRVKKVDIGVGTRMRSPKKIEPKYNNNNNHHQKFYQDKMTSAHDHQKVYQDKMTSAHDDDSYFKESSESEQETILTPELTPPNPTSPKINSNVISNKCSSSIQNVQIPSVSPRLEPLNSPLLSIQEKIKENDVTDCSELEDFVESEPVVNINISSPKQDVEVKEEEECITNIPTPNLATPILDSYSETLGRYAEFLKHLPPPNGTAAAIVKSITASKPNEESCQVEKSVKNIQQHSEASMDDVSSLKSGGKSQNIFDTSQINSSLTSILEIISEGELIVTTGERSPGEISCTMNISPGMHFYRSSSSSDISSSNSTYGFD